jgi:hypothetical protein
VNEQAGTKRRVAPGVHRQLPEPAQIGGGGGFASWQRRGDGGTGRDARDDDGDDDDDVSHPESSRDGWVDGGWDAWLDGYNDQCRYIGIPYVPTPLNRVLLLIK